MFGEVGVLAVDVDNDLVQCAVCGRWLNTVSGAHLMAHGLTAPQYRERFGLGVKTVLEAPGRRAARSASTRERMKKEPKLREMLRAGEADARSGNLTRRTKEVAVRAIRESSARPERARQLRALGRIANQLAREQFLKRIEDRAKDLGFDGIADYFTHRHGQSRSVSFMANELGCGREPAAALLAELSLPGPLDPDHPIERQALARVGYLTLGDFLSAQPVGAGPKYLADQLGHSVPWLVIRARRDGLADRVTPGPTREQKALAAAIAAGFPDLASHVRHLVVVEKFTGAEITAHTGLPAAKVAALLKATGTAAPVQADVLERRALDNVGWAGSLEDYVAARDAQGWTLLRMSAELGRSDFWLARRLRARDAGHLIRPPGHRRDLPPRKLP